MSGLLDAVRQSFRNGGDDSALARAAVEAVAAWLDGQPFYYAPELARVLRAEVAPPPPPTPGTEVVLPSGSTFLAGPDGEQGRWVTSAPITLIWDGPK